MLTNFLKNTQTKNVLMKLAVMMTYAPLVSLTNRYEYYDYNAKVKVINHESVVDLLSKSDINQKPLDHRKDGYYYSISFEKKLSPPEHFALDFIVNEGNHPGDINIIEIPIIEFPVNRYNAEKLQEEYKYFIKNFVSIIEGAKMEIIKEYVRKDRMGR